MKNLFRKSASFTMAEILISLTIIGVIAAITLPSLRANINEKTWATQKKALFSRMSQAVALLDSTNSYASAQSFITEGLNDVLKINNICDGTTLQDCGINTAQYINMSGTNSVFPKTWDDLGLAIAWNSASGDSATSTANKKAAMVSAFETQNGESIVVYYNPDCVPDDEEVPTANSDAFENLKYVCANLVYDLNQDKGPNTVGKDIGFMTVFYASDPVVVSPIPAAKDAACTDKERIPTVNEAVSLVLNQSLMGNITKDVYTSGRALNNGSTFYYTVSKDFGTGTLTNGSGSSGTSSILKSTVSTSATASPTSRCVKR
jgi:type II secretory pathway pseudopilin PulG